MADQIAQKFVHEGVTPRVVILVTDDPNWFMLEHSSNIRDEEEAKMLLKFTAG